MKKILIAIIFSGLTIIAKGQDASVEKSVFGIQTGVLGLWGHYELKLSNKIVLRSELGIDTEFRSGYAVILYPVITIEPRWYYNLNKRERKSRRIDGNSGDFVSFKTSLHPYWIYISKNSHRRKRYNDLIVGFLSIVPTWGIRRNIGNHFNYEAGIGLGVRYIYLFHKSSPYQEHYFETVINLHLRIGYRF